MYRIFVKAQTPADVDLIWKIRVLDYSGAKTKLSKINGKVPFLSDLWSEDDSVIGEKFRVISGANDHITFEVNTSITLKV